MKRRILVVLTAVLAVSIGALMMCGFAPAGDVIYYDDGSDNYATVTKDETLNYTSVQVIDDKIPSSVPLYNNATSLPNSCACISGAVIVGYYDRHYPELIPDFRSYNINPIGNVVYKPQTVEVDAVAQSLYDKMGTNTIKPGTSEDQFREGMDSYLSEKGRRIDYDSVCSFTNSLKMDEVAEAFDNENPVLLLCTKYNIIRYLTINETSMQMTKTTYEDAHMMVAYGIKTIKYYNGSDNFRTDTLLRVSTAMNNNGYNQYVLLDNTIKFVDAYAVNVY